MQRYQRAPPVIPSGGDGHRRGRTTYRTSETPGAAGTSIGRARRSTAGPDRSSGGRSLPPYCSWNVNFDVIEARDKR